MSYRNIGISPEGSCDCDCEDIPVKMEYDVLTSRYVCPKCEAFIDEREVYNLLSHRSCQTNNSSTPSVRKQE